MDHVHNIFKLTLVDCLSTLVIQFYVMYVEYTVIRNAQFYATHAYT